MAPEKVWSNLLSPGCCSIMSGKNLGCYLLRMKTAKAYGTEPLYMYFVICY